MPNSNSESKQPNEASSAHAGWLTRAQVAAELGYRSIFPIREMEGTKLHPVREARGWLFDPAEVAELKTARMAAAPLPATPLSEGRLAARIFYLFDHGRELREIVEELEVPPHVVRNLWHEWMIDLKEGEAEHKKSAHEERRRRREEEERREQERRGEQEQKNFETMMAALTAAAGGSGDPPVDQGVHNIPLAGASPSLSSARQQFLRCVDEEP